MNRVPVSAMETIEATVISFILSGMWWTGMHRMFGIEMAKVALGVVGSTAVIGATLLYLDHGRASPRVIP